ncbi:hypothetical protein JCM8097_003521 [Rhodosporidiobolus ruineniae]
MGFVGAQEQEEGNEARPPSPLIPDSPSHPFADSTNSTSTASASAFYSPTQSKSADVGGMLGIGRPGGVVVSGDARRDITIRPRRQAPPPPSSGPSTVSFPPTPSSPADSFSRSTTSTAPASPSRLPRPTSHRHTQSLSSAPQLPLSLSSSLSSSSPHAPIPAPVYPVRSQPVSVLSRSQSIAQGLKSSTSSEDLGGTGSGGEDLLLTKEEPLPYSPTISGGLARRLSVSSLSASGSEDESGLGAEWQKKEHERRRLERPLAGRSESLPAFPFLPSTEGKGTGDGEEEGRRKREEELGRLPPNPKLWLPSHLALYLTHTLSTTLSPPIPPSSPLMHDITSFILTSRLSGRTFLRLREQDIDELGINVRWRGALTAAREKLLADVAAQQDGALGVPLWGFQGGFGAFSPPAEEYLSPSLDLDGSGGFSSSSALALGVELRRRPSVDVEGSADEDEKGKEEWKASWRTLGGRTPGRVKGLRAAFESGETPPSAEREKKGESERRRSGGGGSGSGRGRGAAWEEQVQTWRGRYRLGGGTHVRGDSTGSNLSAASVDSADGRWDGGGTVKASQSRRRDRPSSGMLFGLDGGPPSEGEDPFGSASASEKEDGPGSGFPWEQHRSTRYPHQTHAHSHSLSSSDPHQPFPYSTPSSSPRKGSQAGSVPRLELDLVSSPPVSPSPARRTRPAQGHGRSYSSPSSSSASVLPVHPGNGYQSSILAHTLPYKPVTSRPSFGEDDHDGADGNASPKGPLPRFLSFEGRQRTLVSSRRSSAGVGAEGGGGKKVAFRELVGQAGAAEYDDDAEEEEEEDEGGETVKPPRRAGSGEGSSAFGSGSGGSGSQASFGAPGSLADLFGLEVPKTRTKAKGLREEGEGEEGLATLFVPGNGGEDGTGRRKGSIVVVKKSQLAALHRRLDEVEALVSSALAASGSPTPSAAGSPVVCRPTVNGGEEDGIEGVVEKVDGLTILPALSLERLTREFLASPTASPVASTADTPASHRSRRSRTRTLSSQYAYADDEDEDGQERELEWPKGWKALSGYVVAASIGIGIVAGEVVLSQVFGMRGRR